MYGSLRYFSNFIAKKKFPIKQILATKTDWRWGKKEKIRTLDKFLAYPKKGVRMERCVDCEQWT